MEKRSWNFTLGLLLAFLVMVGFSIHGRQKWQASQAIAHMQLQTSKQLGITRAEPIVPPSPPTLAYPTIGRVPEYHH
jgi:hypothetical protein